MTKDAWVDLHVHTNFSDGLLSPTQVVQKAKEIGLKAIGIVDHDTIDGIAEAEETGAELGVEIVPGVELSSQFEGRDVHIIGFYFDPVHPRLMEYLERFQQERYKRAAKMIRNLNQLGVRLTMDEVEGRARGHSIGRPHLAEVLMEKGYVETFQEAFQRYIGYGSEAYEEKYKIGPEEAIGLLSEAKGLSFLAHPGYGITDETICQFVKAGLDGMEIIHPKLNQTRTQHLHKVAKQHGLLVSGGSDCHGGRNGKICMGDFSVPYALLEDIRRAFRHRWSQEEIHIQPKEKND